MIKSITIKNPLDESLTLELAAPSKSGFAVLGAEGLGPSKATINSTELATSDGSLFNSARVQSRNILIYLAFEDDPSIEENRQKSYKYFPIRQPIDITIETDQRTVTTQGWVETNEPNIFSKTEGCQISIICPDAYLYSIANQVSTLSGTEALFEFPFSNESTSEDLIDFGNLDPASDVDVVYEGDAEVGVEIEIRATGTATNLSIYNATKREIMTIDTTKLTTLTGDPIIAGDLITISTVVGNKYIRLLRSGVEYNIINTLEQPIQWFTLQKGSNVFTYTADSGEENVSIKIENRIRYVGV